MSIDSELLSILEGGGGEGADRALSPQLSDDDVGLDFSELEIFFEPKGEEEELPDYVYTLYVLTTTINL